MLAANVVVESVWLYATVAVFTLLMLPDGTPVTWAMALIIMGVSLAVARVLSMIIMAAWAPYVLQMVVGLAVIYLTLAGLSYVSGPGFDLGWMGKVTSDEMPVEYNFSVGVAWAVSALMWWRGGRMASLDFPVENLGVSFRVGSLILSVAAIVDIFNEADLNIFPLMFVFFGVGLAGLSVGHILQISRASLARRAWARVIGAVVAGVVLVGLAFSLLQEWALNLIAVPVGFVLGLIGTAILWVIIAPILYVLGFIISFILRGVARLAGEREATRLDPASGGGYLEQLREEALAGEPSVWVQVMEWGVVIILAALALAVLARAFRRSSRWRRIEREGEREGLSEDFDPAMDMARLLFNLLPNRLRRRRGEEGLRLPDDEPGIVDVFRIYFGMLNLAESRGFARRSYQTPDEFRSRLERIFPSRIAEMATEAFNRACYGRRASSEEDIAEMRESLERAAQSRRRR